MECEEEKVIAALDVETDLTSIFNLNLEKLPIKFADLATASKNDGSIQKAIQFVRSNWPNNDLLKQETEIVQLLSRRKDDLSILKGCLMYGDRIVIPKVCQKKIMEQLHKGHPGIKRMKQLARQYVYWPMLDSQIEEFVQKCQPCQAAAKAPVKTDLHSWPKAERPWQRIHVDYAGPFYGKEFLIVVDAFSKYPEVFEMPTKSTAATVDKLRYLFTRHGIPEILVSDNGTQFASNDFAKFTSANGISHLFSAPYNPMSDGQVERFVDTFKRAFRKLKGEGVPGKDIIETFLVTYRTTPNDSLPNIKSLAEMLLGRKPRTTLDLLKPPLSQPSERDAEMERHFNRRFGTKQRIFQLKDTVYARHRLSQNWRAGIICDCKGVIYSVKFPDGSINRYHANQLRERRNLENLEESLNILNETFNLPLPPANFEIVDQDLRNRPESDTEHEDEEQPPANGDDGNRRDQLNRVPSPRERRYPMRDRRMPARYSPG